MNEIRGDYRKFGWNSESEYKKKKCSKIKATTHPPLKSAWQGGVRNLEPTLIKEIILK